MKALFLFPAIILCLNTLATSVHAQNQPDSVDLFIKGMMKKKRIPALQLAVIQHGRVVKNSTYGMANIEQDIPATAESVFSINSITKAFVGVAVMQLAEEGKLNVSDPLAKHLDSLPAEWQKITIKDVMTHTSGLPDIDDENEMVLGNGTEESALKIVKALPMEFKTGERFKYNQTGYVLIGKIITKLSGMHFTAFIESRQFNAVGMKHTRFGDSFDIIPHDAGAYTTIQNVGGRWSYGGPLGKGFIKFPIFYRTAAGIYSTATDMASWIIALQNGTLLKNKASLSLLWEPAVLKNGKTGGFSNLLNGYALGFPTVGRTEHPAVAPVGGGRATFFIYPQDELAVVILTNLMGGNPDTFTDETAAYYLPDMHEANGFGLNPSIKKLRAALIKNGFDQAAAIAAKLQKQDASFKLTEKELNGWGYKLVAEGKLKDALPVFKLNTTLNPKSGNAFDSLAEVQDMLGDKANALKNYKMSLQLDPDNKNAVTQIKKLQGN
jgi:CubicO group peptidase (beta-lactamase class C family)